MPRSVVLGNDHFHVGFDLNYELRDLFFPHIGQENHTAGEPCRTGIWFNGRFSWFSDNAWQRHIDYVDNSLVASVSLSRPDWPLKIDITDAVDFDRNVLVRRFVVRNTADTTGTVRLFFHYDFHIYGVEVGDTVYYDPVPDALIAYKGQRYFIANGSVEGRVGISEYAMGITEVQGREGTWRDAEDGHLQGNPVAQGSVDATIALDLGEIPANGEKISYHWIGAGTGRKEIIDLNEVVKSRGPYSFIERTRDWWRAWSDCKNTALHDVDKGIADLYERSLLTIRSHLDGDGAIIAATDWDIIHYSRDTYNYCWPRDGALVSVALSHAGYLDASRRFFEFCQRVFRPFDGFFLHKFTPSGEVASTWHSWVGNGGTPKLAIQEDETGIVLHALWDFYDRSRSIEFIRELYRPVIRAAADWMESYVDDSTGLPYPSYDLWEERWGVHAYTVACVWAGLEASAKFADLFNQVDIAERWRQRADQIKKAARERFWDEEKGWFVRTLTPDDSGGLHRDGALDASTLAMSLFGMFEPDDERMRSTAQAIESNLWCKTSIGGLARYEHDTYQQVTHSDPNVPGNPWVLTTMWLAQYHAKTARQRSDLDKVKELINWAVHRQQSAGLLPEQVNPYDGSPMSVSPLTWSHAEYVRAVQEYVLAMERLST